jgi:tetratricopeptide (TPR) repeat protein
MRLIYPLILLVALIIPAAAQGQELTDKEKAYRDSIAALNAENEATAAARELYNTGNDLFAEKQYSQAITIFGEAIAKDPSFKDAYYNKGIAEIEAGKFNDASLSLTALLALEKSGKAYFQRALAYQKAGKTTQAEADYIEAGKLDAKNEMIPYNFGVLKYLTQDYEGGIKQFTKAIELKPDFAYAYNDRGSCYRMMQKYPEAIKDYEEAAKRNPNLALALNNVGTVKKLMKDYAGAVAAYNRAMSIDPKFYLAYNNRGAVLMEQGKFDQALEDFNKTIELNKDYAPAYNNRGGVYLKKEDFKKAEEDFSKAIQLDPNYANAYVNRGTAREMLRNPEGACADWAKGRELGSDIAKSYQSSNCQ